MSAFGVVRTWRSAPVSVSATSTLGDRLDETVSRLAGYGFGTTVGSGDGPGPVWSGVAAEIAAERHHQLLLRLARLAAAVRTLDAALRRTSTSLASAETLSLQAATCAAAAGGRLDDAGRYLDLSGSTAATPDTFGPAASAGRAGTGHSAGGPVGLGDLAETLAARAVAEARWADEALAAALRALEPDLASPPSSVPLARPAGRVVPAASAIADLTGGTAGAALADPTQRLAWWDALTPDAQQEAVTAQPDLVGTTDGIPAWARDRANRLRLVRADDALRDAAERLRPSGPDHGSSAALGPETGAATVGLLAGAAGRAASLRVRSRQEALTAVERVLATSDGQRRQLLVLDLSGPSPRAAVAVGDVDRAQHVAVVVPGFTTTVAGDLDGSDRLSAQLADVARREAMGWGDRGQVAVVSWLGYDAPQATDTLSSRSVVLQTSAQAGADALAPFLRGLPPNAHLTVVAHSYGSTTAGLALARGGTGVDDLVAIGSPGLGVRSTRALGLPAAHVHVLEAVDDPVADLGWFGADPSRLAGVDRPSTDAAVRTDGTTGLQSVGHSAYLTPGTTSQWNIAAIVVGLPAVAGRAPTAVRSW